MSETRLCPRCEIHRFTPYQGGPPSEEAARPAMSRVAAEYICSWCGMHEAFMDMAGIELPQPSEWPLPIAQIELAKERLPS